MITKIEFNYSSNFLLNSGIIALNHYLKESKGIIGIEYTYELSEFKLTVESKELYKLLEEVYYRMGRELYDQSKDDGNKKYFFTKEPFEATEFPTMSSYGMAGLITKPPLGPQPVPRKKENGAYFEDLFNDENNKEFTLNIANFYKEHNLKLKFFSFNELGELFKDKNQNKGDSRIFLNEVYTKTPEVDLNDKYFQAGKNVCYMTGEKYNKLVPINSTTPFFSGGIQNFDSHFQKSDKQISWKAMYLSRFSPKLAFYSYCEGIDSLMVYFFGSDNLINQEKIFNRNSQIYKDQIQLANENYLRNLNLYTFGSEKDMSKDYTEQNEFLFMLIYSFYKKLLENKTYAEASDPFEVSELKSIAITLYTFKADKSGDTMRPDNFEEINNFKFLIRMIAHLEKNGVRIKELLSSLKFIKPSEKSAKNHYRMERQLRNGVLSKFIKLQSVLNDIETLYYNCYKCLLSGDYVSYKSYNDLINFVNLYENIIKYGGNETMDKELQRQAVNLGASIGKAILKFDPDYNPKESAKGGRKYIIALKKARTLPQFNEAIERIQFKYGVSVARDILEGINEQNFTLIKQFATISALNQLNMAIHPIKKEESNEGK